MNKTYLLLLVLLLSFAGCRSNEQVASIPPEQAAGSVSSISSVTQTGAEVATSLTARYNDVRTNCGSASMPAFLCRGIVLRSTVPSTAYKAWNPSPHSQKSGGVSFSYLSKDAKFTGLVFGQKNGYIFYPVLSRPIGTRQIEVLCSYPLDGATQLRDAPGCGAHPYSPDRSRRCQTIGITTAEGWIANRRSNSWNLCSFDVRDSMNNQGADSFYQTIRAHQLERFFAGAHDYIELILATWPQNIPKELPIEAFFYLEGGLAGAQFDQKDFFDSTGGKVVPIVKIVLPAIQSADAQFVYSAADQVK
ncbi:halovibrin HvnA [Pseudomonas moraviensis subsp. stanleyae]|uniref:halovibrin HvnA n=1 Tax=Pseudomonas moraviensis TaxID=321662 RepID=UPI002E37FE8F|nr:halovibrin HvnA [Pseudomonas moraviensis]MED7666299.1 halovibrin HvnA [Pseudomonas moraviensis subsp. stanleyae]